MSETFNNTDYWIGEIERELARAVKKFPTWPTDPQHASAVVQEEAGELAKAVLQRMYEPEKASIHDVRQEAIQTAAMCVRFLLSTAHYDWGQGVQHVQNA